MFVVPDRENEKGQYKERVEQLRKISSTFPVEERVNAKMVCVFFYPKAKLMS